MTVYRLRATALCPIDGSRDHYDVELESRTSIEIGEIRRFFDGVANTELLQEELQAAAASQFGVRVTITGQHPSPVEVIG